MFEILKALLALQEACEAHGTVLRWDVYALPGGEVKLQAEVPVTEDDQRFVQDMRTMLGPVTT